MTERDRGFEVRQARWPEDGPALRAVREAVFVAEQGVPKELEWDGRDAACVHVLALDKGARPIGTARMTPEGHIGRMAVLAAWRGRGVGSALLAALLARAVALRLPGVYLNAQTGALGFYARHGFQAEGRTFLDAGIPHRRMALSLDAAR